jgi:hypothetical protein
MESGSDQVTLDQGEHIQGKDGDLHVICFVLPVWSDLMTQILWLICVVFLHLLEETLQTVISVPLLISFCANTTKIIFTKNRLANDVKKHVRLPSQPPFSFLFCAKTKKNCADKKSACEWREETCQTYFQSRRGNSKLF